MKRFISGCLCAAMVAGSIALTGCDDNNGENPNEKPIVGTSVYGMLTDDLINPVGIDDIAPAFSWKVQSDKMGWLQSAYQIVVKQGDSVVWDSGKVEKGISVGVMYEGEALASSTEYQWNVTVWDQDGKETVSDTATFEMGLLEEDAFADVQWISYEEKALYSGEKYTIEFDFVIDNHNQGFCFGMEDTGTFIMWQINTTATPGRVLLRPHFKSGGNWTAYPGGPGNVSAVDVTDAIGESNIVGKTVHERIEVDGKVIKTYFGMDANNMQLANTYTHSKKVSLSNIGFRHSSVDGGEKEVSYYDNIVIKDENGNVLYQNDFSNKETQVAGGKFAKVENGMLKVGTTDGVGEQVYYVSSGDALPAFRKTFTPKENLVSAKLYTAGLGVYEAYINGQRIGRKMADGSVEYCELKPGFTEMADRKFYNTYDITWMLEKGQETVLSAVVSPTWWSDQCAGRYGKNDAFLAKLILTYADGSQEVIGNPEKPALWLLQICIAANPMMPEQICLG